MMPFRQPYWRYMSPTTSLSLLPPSPYCPCMRILNISTGLASTLLERD